METYILRRQNTIAQYIATWKILELCLVAERRSGAQVMIRWWDQSSLNLSQEEMETDT